MPLKYEPEEYIDQLHKELDEYKVELTRYGENLTTFQRLARERGDKLSELERDYAMLQKGLCGTNAELSMAWHKMDALKAELSNAWATAERAEAKNKRLREGIADAIGTINNENDPINAPVSWFIENVRDGLYDALKENDETQ